MVPLGSVITINETFGPESAQRYNAFRAADINANTAPGFSSSQSELAMEKNIGTNLTPGHAI